MSRWECILSYRCVVYADNHKAAADAAREKLDTQGADGCDIKVRLMWPSDFPDQQSVTVTDTQGSG